jgi:hypothetical protein
MGCEAILTYLADDFMRGMYLQQGSVTALNTIQQKIFLKHPNEMPAYYVYIGVRRFFELRNTKTLYFNINPFCKPYKKIPQLSI